VTTPSPPRLEATLGDITLQPVDAVVNAANRQLAGGGGVDGAIHRAAGAADLQAACRAIGHCPPGQAVATPGFNLAAQWIIHTVGPVWRGGDQGEAVTLSSCYRSCLAAADRLGARTLAFPAIATGVYGYPARAAADLAVASVRACTSEVTLIRFVAFDETTLGYYQPLL
jgi:O-acetyl-ADP-ribose deacetylase (regulator of RNase III)